LGGCIRIGANLFSEQLYDTKLHSQVLNALDASGLAPELLELEITETTVLHFDGMVISQLKRIRSLGVGIAFDDYGTGFASLSMLKRYPLSRLKIDREFIQNIHRDASDVAIVQAVLCLGQKLDFEVIAEGMETRQQVDALIRLGCVHGQGYFFGMPMPAPQFEALAQAQIRSMTEDAAA
jgi:EAL domain-containing protein (putative c-di-GMP-specific phosphodiesterase class I)